MICLFPRKTVHYLIQISFTKTFFSALETSNRRWGINLTNTRYGQAAWSLIHKILTLKPLTCDTRWKSTFSSTSVAVLQIFLVSYISITPYWWFFLWEGNFSNWHLRLWLFLACFPLFSWRSILLCSKSFLFRLNSVLNEDTFFWLTILKCTCKIKCTV